MIVLIVTNIIKSTDRWREPVATIEVDFDVFKALTNLRATEADTYNDVIRGLLKLNKASGTTAPCTAPAGVMFDGVIFPEASQFRKSYKGTLYTAEIKNAAFVLADGTKCSSPSAAARKITGNNVNGWRFWECKRPGDQAFRLLERLRPLERFL